MSDLSERLSAPPPQDPLGYLHDSLRTLAALALQSASAPESVAEDNRARAHEWVDAIAFGHALGAAPRECKDAGVSLGDAERTLDAVQLAGGRLLCWAGGERQEDLRGNALAAMNAVTALGKLRAWIEAKTAADDPAVKAGKEEERDENSVMRRGDIWHIRYGKEAGDYPVRGNKCVGWLTRLLARPHRTLAVADLRGDPEGKMAASAAIGAASKTNVRRLVAIRKRLQEIEDINAETGGSESLETEQADLLRQVDESGDGRRMAAPGQRAHHNVASQLRKLRDRLKDAMPTLHAHLHACLQLDSPHFVYTPPADAISWKI